MANDTIGSLVAVTTVTSGQFAAGMKQIEHSLDEAHSHAESLDWGEALKFGAAFELFDRGIEEARESLDRFFETIEQGGRLNIFAEEIGSTVEAISGLHYAAALVDVSGEQINNALQKMLRTIGDARAGSKEAVAAFDEIGLSLRDLSAKSGDEQFKIIADHIAALGSRADETAAAVKLFGRSGADLIPIIDQGSAAIDKMAAAGKAHGAVLTDDQAEAMHQASQALSELGATWQGFLNQLAVDAVPTIKAAAHAIEEFLPWLEQQIASIDLGKIKFVAYTAAIAGSIGVVGQIVSAVQGFTVALKELAGAEGIVEALSGPGGWAALLAGLAGAELAVYGVTSAFDSIDAAAKSAKASGMDAMDGIATTANHAARETRRLAEEAEKALEASLKKGSINPHAAEHAREVFNQAAEDARDAREKIKHETEEQLKLLTKYQNEMISHGEQVSKALETPLEKFRDRMTELRGLLQEGAIGLEVFRRGAEKAQEALHPLKSLESVKIAGADTSTSAGASLDISAGRYAQDLAAQRAEIAQEHFEEAQKQTQIQSDIRDAVTASSGSQSDMAIADF